MAVSKVIINGVTRIDLTEDTVASSNLLSGYTATGADGEPVTGTYGSDATAEAGDIALGKTAYGPDGLIEGTLDASVSNLDDGDNMLYGTGA